jgi:hypothetical protein
VNWLPETGDWRLETGTGKGKKRVSVAFQSLFLARHFEFAPFSLPLQPLKLKNNYEQLRDGIHS